MKISRMYSFAAAHRLEGHPKCGRLHGHNYSVVVTIEGPIGPATGMVIDYGELDKVVKPYMNKYDHRYIVSADNIAKNDAYARLAMVEHHAVIPDIAFSTAECLSQRMASDLASLLGTPEGIAKVTVQVSESPKSNAG